MELIPILSAIILVATISTFLLAIGAYVLYKVRERKGQAAVVRQPSEVKAELVTPSAAPSEQQKFVPQPVYVERQPIIIQQQAPHPASMQPRSTPQPHTVYGQPYAAGSQQPKQYAQPVYGQQRDYSGQPLSGVRASQEKPSMDSKFLKYTSEGYISTKEDKNAGALKWR